MADKKKKNFGWVIQHKKTKRFYGNGDGFVCSRPLSKAHLCRSRAGARAALNEDKSETVRKVSLTETGKPKKIIGRG